MTQHSLSLRLLVEFHMEVDDGYTLLALIKDLTNEGALKVQFDDFDGIVTKWGIAGYVDGDAKKSTDNHS
jgi:hypothetical protein